MICFLRAAMLGRLHCVGPHATGRPRRPMGEMLSQLSVSLWRGGEEGPLRELRRAAAREPDRARRGDLRAAPYRSDAVVSLRLPGRRVRLLRDDGERPAALDLPHARREGRGRRAARDRAAREPARHQGFGDRHAALFRKVAAGEGRVCAVEDAARRDRADQAGQPGADGGRCGDRMHQLRRLLCRLRHGALEFRLSGPGRAQRAPGRW